MDIDHGCTSFLCDLVEQGAEPSDRFSAVLVSTLYLIYRINDDRYIVLVPAPSYDLRSQLLERFRFASKVPVVEVILAEIRRRFSVCLVDRFEPCLKV